MTTMCLVPGVFASLCSSLPRALRAWSPTEEGGRGQGADAGCPHSILHPLLVSALPGHSLYMELVLGAGKEFHCSRGKYHL